MIRLIVFVCSIFFTTKIYAQAPLEPPDGKIIYGMGQDSIVAGDGSWSGVTSGQLTQVHEGIERIFESTGARPLITHFYVGEYTGNADINAWTFEGRLSRLKAFNETQRRSYIPMFSFSFSDINTLTKFFNGDFDNAIRAIGYKAALEDIPVFFRPFYEFNKYGAHDQLFINYAKNNPEKNKEQWFIEAWKKFHGLVASGSNYSRNIAFVWCMNGESENDFIAYYPGNNFVDWVGIDIFNTLHLNNAAGPIITWIKNNTDRGDGKPKPVILPEVQPAMSPTGQGDMGTQAKQAAVEKFFIPLFNFIESNNEVKGFVYINYWFKKIYEDDPSGNNWLAGNSLLLWGDGRVQPILEADFDTAVFDFFAGKISNKKKYLYEGDVNQLYFNENASSSSSSSFSSATKSSSQSSFGQLSSMSSSSVKKDTNKPAGGMADTHIIILITLIGFFLSKKTIKIETKNNSYAILSNIRS